MAFELIAALALVAANGFFVATEFAITRLRPTQLDEFDSAGRAGSRSTRHAVEHIDAYLAACQLGITLASIGLGVVGKPAFEELLEPVLGSGAAVAGIGLAAALAFGIITLLHVVVGELAPKSLAIARTDRTSLLVAPMMRVFYFVTKPVVDLFNGMGNLLLKPFGIPPASEAGHAPHSERELRTLLKESQAEGLIEPEDLEFAENVFSFGDRRVREILMPRPEVDFVTTDADVQSTARRAIETGHTRFPLCDPDGGLDSAIGAIHAKDLLGVALDDREVELRELARPLGRVSESNLIGEVLRDLRRQRQHMALVIDEHGTAIGVVTLEDILEELVGEIEDEFDPQTAEHIRREGGITVVDGSTPIRLLSQELGIEIPDPHEATIGGHILELLGRLPAVGEVVEFDGQLAEVSGVADARIAELRLKARSGPSEGGGPSEEGDGPGRPAE